MRMRVRSSVERRRMALMEKRVRFVGIVVALVGGVGEGGRLGRRGFLLLIYLHGKEHLLSFNRRLS